MSIKKSTFFGIGGTILTVAYGLIKKGSKTDAFNITYKGLTESEKSFGGISLSKLNEIAKSIDLRDYCTIDQYGFLVLHYKSNRGRQNFQTQLDIDETLKLFNLNGGPVFSGQVRSHASDFVKKVNETIKFKSIRK